MNGYLNYPMSKLQVYGRGVLLKFSKNVFAFKTTASSSLLFHEMKQFNYMFYKALVIIKKFLCFKFHVTAMLKKFVKNPSTF